VPEKVTVGDPSDLIASLRAQIPEEHTRFIGGLLAKYDIPELPADAIASYTDDVVAAINRFEDITPMDVKQKFLAASSGDTIRSPLRTGKPARQLRSVYHDEREESGSPAACRCRSNLCL
jgi:hypothetical protein